MMSKHFTEEQIIRILKEAEALGNTQEVCTRHNITEQTLYRWRNRFGIGVRRLDPEDYAELPDSMTAYEVARCFNQLLVQAKHLGVSEDAVIEALCDLADRQYHTREGLRPDVRDRVEQWICTNWKPTPQWVDAIGMIAGAIGLPRVIPLLEAFLAKQPPGEIRDELEETLCEIRPHIDDPYWSFRGPGVELVSDVVGTGAPVETHKIYQFELRMWLACGDPVRWSTPWGLANRARIEDDGATLVADLRFGDKSMFAGLLAGVAGMRVGGIRRFRIAPHRVYGEEGVPGSIPPNALLTVEVRVLLQR